MSDKIKYPLPCGCASDKYISKCALHQREQLNRDATLAGVCDMMLTAEHVQSDDGAQHIIAELRARIKARPFHSLLVKIIP